MADAFEDDVEPAITIDEYFDEVEAEELRDGNGLSFLDELGYVEKMEVLHGIAVLKDEFCSFLSSVHESSDPSKPITTTDVHKLFENLAKKRQRLQ